MTAPRVRDNPELGGRLFARFIANHCVSARCRWLRGINQDVGSHAGGAFTCTIAALIGR
jgi:hypothetical protein